tara:strand:- start:772 stop:1020 length:249 start_codon:yes stop_codon:yes gene_type:complete
MQGCSSERKAGLVLSRSRRQLANHEQSISLAEYEMKLQRAQSAHSATQAARAVPSLVTFWSAHAPLLPELHKPSNPSPVRAQ